MCHALKNYSTRPNLSSVQPLIQLSVGSIFIEHRKFYILQSHKNCICRTKSKQCRMWQDVKLKTGLGSCPEKLSSAAGLTLNKTVS